jgi:hypothetical protein
LLDANGIGQLWLAPVSLLAQLLDFFSKVYGRSPVGENIRTASEYSWIVS